MPMWIKPHSQSNDVEPKERSIPQPEYMVGFLEEQILRLLDRKGTLVRDEMCEALDRPRSTIFDNLIILVQHGFVKYFTQKQERKGRPFTFFEITPLGKQWVAEHIKEEL